MHNAPDLRPGIRRLLPFTSIALNKRITVSILTGRRRF
jgi:hypothetical protein